MEARFDNEDVEYGLNLRRLERSRHLALFVSLICFSAFGFLVGMAGNQYWTMSAAQFCHREMSPSRESHRGAQRSKSKKTDDSKHRCRGMSEYITIMVGLSNGPTSKRSLKPPLRLESHLNVSNETCLCISYLLTDDADVNANVHARPLSQSRDPVDQVSISETSNGQRATDVKNVRLHDCLVSSGPVLS